MELDSYELHTLLASVPSFTVWTRFNIKNCARTFRQKIFEIAIADPAFFATLQWTTTQIFCESSAASRSLLTKCCKFDTIQTTAPLSGRKRSASEISNFRRKVRYERSTPIYNNYTHATTQFWTRRVSVSQGQSTRCDFYPKHYWIFGRKCFGSKVVSCRRA